MPRDARSPAAGEVETSRHRAAAAVMTAVVIAGFVASRLAIASIPSEREYDEGVYLLSARAVAHGHELFTSVFSGQPPAFLESLALAMRIAGDTLQTGRIYILAFSVLAMVSIAGIARRIAGIWAAPVAVAALALSATFLDLAHVVQSETPSLAVGLASLCACLHARARSWHRGWLFASGALFALALLLKLFVVPVAVPLALLLLLAPETGGAAQWTPDGPAPQALRRAGGRALVVVGGALVVACIPLLFYDTGALYSQTVGFQLAKHKVYALDPFANLTRVARHLTADGAVAITAAAGAIWLLARRRIEFAWLLCWLLATLAVLVGQTPLFWRHFVLLSPIIALASAALASPLANPQSLPRAVAATLGVLLFWIYPAIARPSAVFPIVPQTALEERNASPVLAVANWIRTNSTEEDLVSGDDPTAIFLAGRQAPPALCDTSHARINSKYLTLREARQESLAARVIVLKQNGRLSHLGGYPAWLEKNYEKQPELLLSTPRTFWIRKESAADEPARGER